MASSIIKALAAGLTAPSNGMFQKLMFGRPASVPDDAGDGFSWNAPWTLVSATGRPLNERAVLQLSAAMACVRLLSQTISTLPLGIYKRLYDGGRTADTSHSLYEILHNQPNQDMTAVDFWQVIIAWMMLRGNAYAEKLKIGSRIVGLIPLQTPFVSAATDGSGDYFYTEKGKRRRILKADMWHIPAFTLDGINGISPIAYGASIFGGAISADEASQSIFENGMAASGFITMPDKTWLKEDQRNSLREHLNEFSHSGAKRRENFILEGGLDYKPLSLNPEDAQMLETRMFNIEEVCRWFGLDPSLIGHGQKVSNFGTGLEEKNLGFLAYCLTPTLRKLEMSIRLNLFSPAEKTLHFAEFNVAALLRGNAVARADYYSRMVNNGLMTRDEVRRLENQPAMGGNAEVLTVQTALTPIDKLGEKAALVSAQDTIKELA